MFWVGTDGLQGQTGIDSGGLPERRVEAVESPRAQPRRIIVDLSARKGLVRIEGLKD